jgi:hypothetical protein
LRQVAIEEGFVCTVCTEKEIESIELVEIWF